MPKIEMGNKCRQKKKQSEMCGSENPEGLADMSIARKFYEKIPWLKEDFNTGVDSRRTLRGYLVTEAAIILNLQREQISSLLNGSESRW